MQDGTIIHRVESLYPVWQRTMPIWIDVLICCMHFLFSSTRWHYRYPMGEHRADGGPSE